MLMEMHIIGYLIASFQFKCFQVPFHIISCLIWWFGNWYNIDHIIHVFSYSNATVYNYWHIWHMTHRSWQLRIRSWGFVQKKTPKNWLFGLFGNTFLFTKRSKMYIFVFQGRYKYLVTHRSGFSIFCRF